MKMAWLWICFWMASWTYQVATGQDSTHFTDQWAVRVDGGSEQLAQEIAARHGFVYVGKVSRCFLFWHCVYSCAIGEWVEKVASRC